MITCDVCGHLNSPERVTCEECGSDLSDSPDWDIYDIDDFGDDMLDFDDAEELGYVNPDDYEWGDDMWECDYCGEINDDDTDVCENCGAVYGVNQGWVGENYG